MYPTTFGHVSTCVYMNYRPNEPFVPSSRGSSMYPWYTVDRKISDNNLEQQINIGFFL
jgi:hypothetical protein